MRQNFPLSRRQLLIGNACLCCVASLGRGAQAHGSSWTTTEVARGVHVRRGVHEEATARNADAIANTGFIVGRDAVAVTEAGGSLLDGRRLRARIREVTPLPVRHVILSHVHPDHIFGAGAFTADAPAFVGHAQLPRALAERGEFYRRRLEQVLGRESVGPIVPPTMLVQDEARIDLGGRVLRLRAHGIGHTDCDLSVFDEASRTLFAGDLLFVGRVPSLDGSLKGWLRELEVLRGLGAERAVPGHGPASVRVAPAVLQLEHYLQVLLRETREAIRAGIEIGEAAEVVGRSEREKWVLFDEYHGHNVTQAFKELEWE